MKHGGEQKEVSHGRGPLRMTVTNLSIAQQTIASLVNGTLTILIGRLVVGENSHNPQETWQP